MAVLNEPRELEFACEIFFAFRMIARDRSFSRDTPLCFPFFLKKLVRKRVVNYLVTFYWGLMRSGFLIITISLFLVLHMFKIFKIQ